MNCGQCGHINAANAKFCEHCGTPLQTAAENRQQPSQPWEQAPAQQPWEQTPAQQPWEQAPAQQPQEQAPTQQPWEQTPVQQPWEQAPAQQPWKPAPSQQSWQSADPQQSSSQQPQGWSANQQWGPGRPPWEQGANPQQPYQPPYQYQRTQPRQAALVLGIISIIMSFFNFIIPLILSIVGIVIASEDVKAGIEEANKYRILNIIAIVLNCGTLILFRIVGGLLLTFLHKIN